MTKTDAEICAAIGQAIKERSDKLAEKHERGAEERGEVTARVEAILAVFADFDEHYEAEELRLRSDAAGDKLAPLALTSALDDLSQRFAVVEKHLSQNATALPNYEVRRVQESLRKQREQFQTLQADLQPKKKFGFRGKKTKKSTAAAEDSAERKAIAPRAGLTQEGYALEDKTGETIVISGNEINSKDVLFKNLSGVRVKVTGNPSTLHLTNLKDSTVFCGPVSSSIFLEDCANCKFVLACQQLRTHKTTDSTFYLHVTSKAIIEDCTGLGFAPYPLDESNESLMGDFEASGLDRGRNNWDDVDDFNWLAADKASPNWSIVPESERESFEKY